MDRHRGRCPDERERSGTKKVGIPDQIRSSSDDLDNASRIMEEWWHNCIHRPLRVQVTLPKGAVSGISKGIDEDGALLIETNGGKIRKVSEGSLRLLYD